MEPCGAPEVTGTSDDLSPSSTKTWVRPIKNDFIQFSVFPLIPCCESLNNSFKCFIESFTKV